MDLCTGMASGNHQHHHHHHLNAHSLHTSADWPVVEPAVPALRTTGTEAISDVTAYGTVSKLSNSPRTEHRVRFCCALFGKTTGASALGRERFRRPASCEQITDTLYAQAPVQLTRTAPALSYKEGVAEQSRDTD